jgi:hypothetical protein
MLYLIVGGIVGVGILLIILVMIRRAKHLASLIGPAPCIKCGKELLQLSWVRRGLRGELFKCRSCGTQQWWNFKVTPPVPRG